jgi:membrane-associated protein
VGAVIGSFSQVGYAALAGLVLGESVGIPLPGSTALLGAGVLAADGKLNIVVICVLGFVLTVTGANIAFAVGSKLGTGILTRPGPFMRHRETLLAKGAPVVQRFGWLAAFANRFIPVLKECGALLVGALGLTWRDFLLWNTPGGLAWVLSHALLGYFLGKTFGVQGSVVAIAVIDLVVVALALTVKYLRAIRKRRQAQSRLAVEQQE